MTVGIILGLVVAEKVTSLATFSSLGTLGAAIAAFWAVYLNSQDQRRKRAQDELAQQPYLIVSEAEFKTFNAEVGDIAVTFTNLSQHPVHIRDAVVYSDDDPPDVITVGLLIRPSETAVYKTSYDVHFVEDGDLTFMFNYAPTGPVLHSISLPYKPRRRPSDKEMREIGQGPFNYPYTLLFFLVADQKLETNVEDKAKRAYEFVEEMHKHQWG